MDWHERIKIDPNVMGGKPVTHGTRVPVETIIGCLAGGYDVRRAAEQFHVAEEDVRAALAYAAKALAEERVHALPG